MNLIRKVIGYPVIAIGMLLFFIGTSIVIGFKATNKVISIIDNLIKIASEEIHK